IHQHRTRSIERHRPQIARHGMTGCSDLEYKIFAATGTGRCQYPDNSFDQSPLMQGEREYVGRRRWNGSAASAFERADHFGIGIAQDRREVLAVALDIDGGDEFVVAPNLPPGAARHRGSYREVHDVVRGNRVARRRCQDGYADLLVLAE